MREAEILAPEEAHGPEDVAVDSQGRILGGLVDGRILRLTPTGGGFTSETFAETGGRPLGLELEGGGTLLVADARQGLLAVSPRGEVEVLASSAEGLELGFTDDLDVASDGTVYFTDASSRFGVDEYLYDLLEARPHGRLLSYDPATRQVRVLLDGLYFANGVALSRGEDFLLVNETYRYRVLRYWLKGAPGGDGGGLPRRPAGLSRRRVFGRAGGLLAGSLHRPQPPHGPPPPPPLGQGPAGQAAQGSVAEAGPLWPGAGGGGRR